MRTLTTRGLVAASAVAVAVGLTAGVTPASAADLPTVVLVHGQFADSTSWDGVAADLRGNGYTVLTPDNPLRGPGYDAAAIDKVVESVPGPVILVGHSYGGTVITNVHADNVEALVYVAAFAPAQYEPALLEIDPIRFPGSQLLPPVLEVKVVDDPTAPGGENLDAYIDPARFHDVFAPDVSAETAATMIAHQKSAALTANIEPSGPPSYVGTRSYALIAKQDKVIPAAAERFMAQRAGAQIVEADGSHAILVSRPDVVADLVETAATGQ